MRHWVIVVAIGIAVALLFILCAAWPLWALYNLADAIERRDSAAVARMIEFPELRRSLADQIAHTYLTITGLDRKLGPLGSGLVLGSIADPLLTQFVTPEGVATLLGQGWPEGLQNQEPSFVSRGIDPAHLGSVWRLFAAARYRGREFSISLPLSREPADQFRLQLRLFGSNWKLVGVDLPVELNIRFARILITARKPG